MVTFWSIQVFHVCLLVSCTTPVSLASSRHCSLVRWPFSTASRLTFTALPRHHSWRGRHYSWAGSLGLAQYSELFGADCFICGACFRAISFLSCHGGQRGGHFWWGSRGESYQWRVQDLEEEHAVPLWLGYDPRSGVAEPDCSGKVVWDRNCRFKMRQNVNVSVVAWRYASRRQGLQCS